MKDYILYQLNEEMSVIIIAIHKNVDTEQEYNQPLHDSGATHKHFVYLKKYTCELNPGTDCLPAQHNLIFKNVLYKFSIIYYINVISRRQGCTGEW